MKIYNTDNNNCTTTNTNAIIAQSITTLTNVAVVPDSNCNTTCNVQCEDLSRFKILGVAYIDPKRSYVCGCDTLTVCGNLEVCGNVTINGNLTVLGDTIINITDLSVNNLTVSGWLDACDISACNLDLSQNLTVLGDTNIFNLTVNGDVIACDISACNLDLSQNLTVAGDTTLVDVSATNIDVTEDVNIGGDLTVAGDTTLVDVTANIIQYKNNSQFFNWGVHIIPITGRDFQLAMITRFSTTNATQIRNIILMWGRGGIDENEGGWIYPGYGGYGVFQHNPVPPAVGRMPAWSDRSAYPTDGFLNRFGGGSLYEYAIGLSIPFSGQLTALYSRFSWMMGRYDPAAPVVPFILTLRFYHIRCVAGQPQFPGIDQHIEQCEIRRKCGNSNWGAPSGGGITWSGHPASTVISAGDAIGIYIVSNIPDGFGTGEIHSPSTFTLEVQRDL